MADNRTLQSATLASLPSGGEYAMDEISSVLYLREKVTLGPDGTATADWAGRAIASEGGAGYVDPRPKAFDLHVDVTTSSTAYAAGDSFGGELAFANAARTSGGSVELRSLVIENPVHTVLPDLDVVFCADALTSGDTNDAAFDPADGELDNIRHVELVRAGDWVTFTDNAVAVVSLPPVSFNLAAMTLYVYLVDRTGVTLGVTSGVGVRVTGYQD